MTKTKSLARMYVWWPSIDKDIEKSVQLCQHCQQQQPVLCCTLEVAVTAMGEASHGFCRTI